MNILWLELEGYNILYKKWLSTQCWPRPSTNECLLEVFIPCATSGWLGQRVPMGLPALISAPSPSQNSVLRWEFQQQAWWRVKSVPSICPPSSLRGYVFKKRTSHMLPGEPRVGGFIIPSDVHVSVQLCHPPVTAYATEWACSAFLFPDWLMNSHLPFKSQLRCHLNSSTLPDPSSGIITLSSGSP